MQTNQLKKLASVLVLACAAPVAAVAGDIGSVYLDLGMNGIGLGYGHSLSENWAARVQYNKYLRSFTGDVGDYGAQANMKLDFTLSSLQLLADWYPFSGGFRFTGGVVKNDNKISLAATNANVGNLTGQTVNGEITMSKSPSPYLGIGYSSRPQSASGFGFVFDFGVMGQDPDVSLSIPGATAAQQADIDQQIAKTRSSLSPLKTWPVLSLGLSYSF